MSMGPRPVRLPKRNLGIALLGNSAPLADISRGQCRIAPRWAIADTMDESRMGPRHQGDCECNSTGADVALCYVRTAISVYSDRQFPMALTTIIAS